MLLDITSLLNNVKGIIHVGAHHGQECSSYLSDNVKQICMFEPVQEHFNVMKENIKDDRVRMFNVALGSERKTAVINLSDFNGPNRHSVKGQSSSLLKPKKHLLQYPMITFGETTNIEVHTLDSFSEGENINPEDYDLMVIDVQGYEMEVLRGATKFLPLVKYIITEVNREELYEDCAMVEDIDQFLSEYGFMRMTTNWAGGTWGDALYAKQ